MNTRQFSEKYLRQYLGGRKPPYVFLETLVFDKENKTSFLFSDFVDVLVFNHGDDPGLFFKKAESYLKKGFWLSGYFSYEFGYFLEPALYHLREYNKEPLAWLGVCKKPEVINHKEKRFFSKDNNSLSINYYWKGQNRKSDLNQPEYSRQIRKIKQYLEQGFSYQVNFTFKIKFDFEGKALDLYLDLRRSQPTSYAALISTGQSHIISLSPELFFKIEEGKIVSRPMKGTMSRGLTLRQDKKAKEFLRKSKKIKAENLMIVDLLRNDLGRIAEKVWVPNLFKIEKYRTLYQMTSTIEAKLKQNLKLKELFSSLFPCGSVTGAPKIKTMEIIKDLEKEPRGVYTGAIGYISPSQEACFNVAIRTIHIKDGKGELGVGGGIVYDSKDESEYSEALLKAKFFMEGVSKINLMETILWSKKYGYFLLELHLKRLKKSCKYFAIPLDIKAVRRKLEEIVNFEKGRLKIRVLVNGAGNIHIERKVLEEVGSLVKVKISSRRVDPSNRFLYHKTDQRVLYNQERKKANSEGFFEVIFLNIQGEVTEGTISNLFILKHKQLYTPALECGLLAGTLREHLLNKGRVKEKVLYLQDILEADKVYIGNSVRGLIEAKIVLPCNKLKAIEEVGVFDRM